jgi:hypothetical protein
MCENCKKPNDSIGEILKKHPLFKILGLDNMDIGDGALPLSVEEFNTAMKSFKEQHGRIPHPMELAQYILSSKANPGNKKSSEEPSLSFNKIIKGSPLFEMLGKMATSCEECNGCDAGPNPSDCSEEPKSDFNSKPIEVSYEEMVEQATLDLKAFLSTLHDKYDSSIVAAALDEVILYPEEEINPDDVKLALCKIDNIDENLSILASRVLDFIDAEQKPTMMVGEAISLEPRLFSFPRFSTVQTLIKARRAIKEEMHNYKTGTERYKQLKAISKAIKVEINSPY